MLLMCDFLPWDWYLPERKIMEQNRTALRPEVSPVPASNSVLDKRPVREPRSCANPEGVLCLCALRSRRTQCDFGSVDLHAGPVSFRPQRHGIIPPNKS
jgi:hypothetical protein